MDIYIIHKQAVEQSRFQHLCVWNKNNNKKIEVGTQSKRKENVQQQSNGAKLASRKIHTSIKLLNYRHFQYVYLYKNGKKIKTLSFSKNIKTKDQNKKCLHKVDENINNNE